MVDTYFKQNHTKGQHPYITIAYPAAAKMGMDDVIAKSGDSIATQNPVWQNEEGNVTKRSILGYAGYTEPAKDVSANEQLFNALKAKKLYDGDYNNFTEQFSTEDTQNQLFKALKAKKQYDGDAGEFLNTFFPIASFNKDSTDFFCFLSLICFFSFTSFIFLQVKKYPSLSQNSKSPSSFMML